MASEQVRLASEALGPLLRKRGTSPALGANLRRAVQALDRALTEDDEPTAAEAASRAAKELQECLPLIRGSQRPADRAQLDGVTKALSLLLSEPPSPTVALQAPIQETLPMMLPPLGASGAPEALPQIAPPAAPEARPSNLPSAPPPAAAAAHEEPPAVAVPQLRFPTADLRIAGLQESLRLLHAVSHNRLATLEDLESAHARLRKLTSAVKWLGSKRIPHFRETSAKRDNSGKRVATDLALSFLGDNGSVEELLASLEKAASKDWLPTHLPSALNVLAATEALEILLTFFAKTSSPALRALLLPVLAERGALSAGRLLDLALDPDDGVAARAAEALAWDADAAEASLLFDWAMQAKVTLRADALLFAATALGSTAALAEARKRLAKPTMSMGYLVDALAIAGDDGDVDRLLDAAVTPNPDTAHVLLAAASLGNAKTAFEFDDFDRHVPAAVLEEIPRMILGKGGLPPRPRLLPPEKAKRMLRGRPWSVVGALDRLSAADEPLLSAHRMALEIRVRSGIAPPCRLPLLASAAERSEIVARWRDHYAKADAKLVPGGWYYQGKPVPNPEIKERSR